MKIVSSYESGGYAVTEFDHGLNRIIKLEQGPVSVSLKTSAPGGDRTDIPVEIFTRLDDLFSGLRSVRDAIEEEI